MNEWIALAVSQLPAMIASFRTTAVDTHPELPPPTDADVIAAFNAAYDRSLAVDNQWLADNPPDPAA